MVEIPVRILNNFKAALRANKIIHRHPLFKKSLETFGAHQIIQEALFNPSLSSHQDKGIGTIKETIISNVPVNTAMHSPALNNGRSPGRIIQLHLNRKTIMHLKGAADIWAAAAAKERALRAADGNKA